MTDGFYAGFNKVQAEYVAVLCRKNKFGLLEDTENVGTLIRIMGKRLRLKCNCRLENDDLVFMHHLPFEYPACF